jgi:hypothetical protein
VVEDIPAWTAQLSSVCLLGIVNGKKKEPFMTAFSGLQIGSEFKTQG